MVLGFGTKRQTQTALEQLIASRRYRNLSSAISEMVCDQAVFDCHLPAIPADGRTNREARFRFRNCRGP